MINLQIRQFRNSIIGITNASPLPPEIKRLVFVEIKNQLEEEANKVISYEKEKNNTQEEKNND